VLVVEDDDVFRRLVARALELHGLRVWEAPSCEEAARALERGLRPGLVLLDVNLPGDTGWGFLRGRWVSDAGSPPVVVVSGTAPQPRRLEEFGVAGYLPKPFALETLLETVARLLRERAAAQHA
jgi:CheY-like chemotaxis protein